MIKVTKLVGRIKQGSQLQHNRHGHLHDALKVAFDPGKQVNSTTDGQQWRSVQGDQALLAQLFRVIVQRFVKTLELPDHLFELIPQRVNLVAQRTKCVQNFVQDLVVGVHQLDAAEILLWGIQPNRYRGCRRFFKTYVRCETLQLNIVTVQKDSELFDLGGTVVI